MALTYEPRGELFMSSDTNISRGWRGIIFGRATMWGGTVRSTRSGAFKDMRRANKDNKFGAKLKPPLPDDPVK